MKKQAIKLLQLRLNSAAVIRVVHSMCRNLWENLSSVSSLTAELPLCPSVAVLASSVAMETPDECSPDYTEGCK